MRWLTVLLLLGVSARAAQAGPGAPGSGTVELRVASIAPDGSYYAQAIHALARDIVERTAGRIKIKVYLNGVAGDELEVYDRLGRGQLDGVISAGMICQRVAPSLQVLRLPALFQNRAEATYVLNALKPLVTAEAARAGYLFIASATLGPELLFSKRPIRTFREVQKARLWRWRPDRVPKLANDAMGFTTVLADVDQVNPLLDRDQIDGLWTIPSGALVFEWSIRATYILDLSDSQPSGCFIIKSASLPNLTPEDRRALFSAGARLREHLNQEGARVDAQLLGGVFQHQGVHLIEPSERLREQFFAAAIAARKRLTPSTIPQALLDRVLELISDYRAEHPTGR